MLRAVLKVARAQLTKTPKTAVVSPARILSTPTVKKISKMPGRFYHQDYSQYSKREEFDFKKIVLGAVVGGVSAGLYIAHDYVQAKKGIKKRSPEKPLTGLDFLYMKIKKDEKLRRELGLIPDKLFAAGKIAMDEEKSPDKWFDKLLLVTPNASEMQLYSEVAEIYYSKGEIDKALKFWEHITESENMIKFYSKAAEAYFNKQEFTAAEDCWKKAKVPMGEKYALLGKACYEKKALSQAATFLENARRENYISNEILIQLGHIHLTKHNPKYPHNVEHSEALELFKKTQEFNKDVCQDAMTLNEIGVCIFMNALALQNKDFENQQLSAISYFEKAAVLSPSDSVIAMNLEIAKTLNSTPTYGYPHQYLQCTDSKPTPMFDAINMELKRYSTMTITSSDVGFGITPTFNDKGGFSGVSPVITTTDHSMNVPRHENIIAINKLADLKLKQRLMQKNSVTFVNQVLVRSI